MPGPARPRLTPTEDIDAWVRHIVGIQFDPDGGAPYWLNRAAELGIDARREIETYQDLSKLGVFRLEDLRTINVFDLLPVSRRADTSRLRVHETGGTTGLPSKLIVRDFFDPIHEFMDWYLDEVVSFPRGGNWIFVGPPGGPHGIAESTGEIARMRGGVCFFIDLDPRFLKELFNQQDMKTIGLYLEHVRRQMYAILDTQDVDHLATTPLLLEMLAPELHEGGYQFKGLLYGGTQLSADLYRLLRTEYFPTAVQTAVYGNTLMGGAFLRPPVDADDNEIVYYPVEPLVKLEVVDPENPAEVVAMGQTGRVRLTVLSEERFLPWVLERDIAERAPVFDVLGWEGVANVRSPITQSPSATVGVY